MPAVDQTRSIGSALPATIATEPTRPRRIELILRQIDSLPTLPAIATRLLSLTASDDSQTREVVELISADPALTAKVLSLCCAADKGVRADVLTIERAVVLLGFNAIRNAVLSVKVFEMFNDPARNTGGPGNEPDGHDPEPSMFDRPGFWTHCLAVAVLAELIAKAHPSHRDLPPDEAFVCGLIHDLGKIAFDYVLPKSYVRVIELACFNQGNISEFERRIVGIDHHTAGKRLAEKWQLPHRLQDCIWLHGSAYDTLPRLEHRRLVGLVGLADQIARQQHIGFSGNFSTTNDIGPLMQKLDLDRRAVDACLVDFHDRLEVHSKALGLNDKPSRELFLQAIQQANESLGRLNQGLDRRSRTAASQARILEAVAAFHDGAIPGRSVQDVLDAVVASARNLFGPGFYAVLYPRGPKGEDALWLMCQYNKDAEPIHAQYIDAPPHAPDLSQLGASSPVGMNLMGVLPWIADYLGEADDLCEVRMMPLNCGWGSAAVLLCDNHPAAVGVAPNQLSAIASTWGAAVAAAAHHDGARRMGEQLAQANSALAEAQDRLLQTESMARLGEMAAGAAHEMNNPLAVISGRSQLLSMTLRPGSKDQSAAQTIYNEAHRLSDLITCLRMFAEPPRPQRQPTDVGGLLDETIKKVTTEHLKSRDPATVTLKVKEPLSGVDIDRSMVQLAVTELLVNAIQARAKQTVQVLAQMEPGDEAVAIKVIDDGDGMDAHTLDHAMDPFFSAKAAGRRLGMGLPRARQIAAAHGGRLELRSSPGKGTVATMTLPLVSPA